MPNIKPSKNNVHTKKQRFLSKDKQSLNSPGKNDKKTERKNTLMCILKIKFNMPLKETKNQKKGSPGKEEYMMLNDTSFETKPHKAYNNNSLKKRSHHNNSNEREKNYCYNQFNITNQVFNNSKKIKERNQSIEGEKIEVKIFDNDYYNPSKIIHNYRKPDTTEDKDKST